MNISSADLSNALPRLATTMKREEITQAVQAAVLKQAMNQEKQAGAAIVKMIESAPAARSSSNLVDIRI